MVDGVLFIANVCNTKIKLQNTKKGSQFSFDMGKRK